MQTWGDKIDVPNHELVPKHEILSKGEKTKVLEKYNTTANHLPKILVSDPAVEKLEAKVGDVVRITRMSQTVGESLYYRVVVSG